RFVCRCNALLLSIQVIRQALVFKEVEGMSVSIIDSFPIPLCQHIRNFRSKVLGDDANVGYNATKRQYFYGCKCHALVSESGYVIDYTIT
ncbi:transposase, partial [Bifidobacterium pseudocatenulatum]|nr:transposase [Bifidobacterium pseudocatenulatum]